MSKATYGERIMVCMRAGDRIGIFSEPYTFEVVRMVDIGGVRHAVAREVKGTKERCVPYELIKDLS